MSAPHWHMFRACLLALCLGLAAAGLPARAELPTLKLALAETLAGAHQGAAAKGASTAAVRRPGQTQAAQPTQPTQPLPQPRFKPYHADDYELAYQALLAAADRAGALQLTQQALLAVPADANWRRRLAQLAEWTQQPQLAWTAWRWLFDQGARDADTLAAVQRLAPFVGEPQAALSAWQLRLQRGERLTAAQWRDVVNLYETLAEPQAGSRFFEEHYRRLHEPELLMHAAQLAAHAGDDVRALRLYDERVQLAPLSVDALLAASIIELRHDQTEAAYARLRSQRLQVPATASAYWQLLASMAFELADASTAEAALQQLPADSDAAREGWQRLPGLLRLTAPERAAELMLLQYQRQGDSDMLLAGLELYEELGQRSVITRQLAGLTGAQRATLEAIPRFLLLRARQHQWQRAPQLAWQDYQRALSLQPQEPSIISAVAWFLIDQSRLKELESLLRRHQEQAAQAPVLWLAYAAGYHALDRYREALPWYQREVQRQPQDMLLLLNYADLLERLQQAGMAQRLRRHAWLVLRETEAGKPLQAPLDSQPQLLALARLVLQDSPGDPALALVRQLVSELRGLPGAQGAPAATEPAHVVGPDPEAPATNQTHDLILAWAISREQHYNARRWLWLSHARRAQAWQPPWGEAQTALSLNETERMDALLLRQADSLPIYSRYDTAHALGHAQQALALAFEGMDRNGADEELHDRYRQHAPRHVSHAELILGQARYGELERQERGVRLQLALDRRLHVGLSWSRHAQRGTDGGVPVAPHDRLEGLAAHWLGESGDTHVELLRRRELASHSGWRLQHNRQATARLGLNLRLAYRDLASDSQALRLAGRQDSLSLGLQYALGKREHVALTQSFSRYQTQLGDALGHGRLTELEIGHRLRIDYPDWRVRAYASHQGYSYAASLGAPSRAALNPALQAAISSGAVDGVRYFMPDGSTTLGACVGMGENLAGQNLREVYTRAWRHFYDVCATHNSINAGGYAGVLGVAGSVLGEDLLSLRLEQSSGGSGSGALSRLLSARYRYYF